MASSIALLDFCRVSSLKSPTGCGLAESVAIEEFSKVLDGCDNNAASASSREAGAKGSSELIEVHEIPRL
eukprot:scaffold25614_cov37-Prasinocladus_malaysianus.AAC.1